MAFDPALHTASNKPYASWGTPTDARYWYYDDSIFTYRPYNSTGEVLSYLVGADARAGAVTVQVMVTGVLREYWFRDGVADGDLIAKTPELTWDSGTGDLGLLGGASVNLDGRYSLIGHTHPISDITGLQTALDSKMNRSNTITSGYGILASPDFSGPVSIELNTSVVDNRYLRKDVSDNNGANTLTLGALVAGNTTINGTLNATSLAAGLITDQMLVRDASTGAVKYLAMPSFGGAFNVANGSGVDQFTVDSGQQLQFVGTGDSSVAFTTVGTGVYRITINSTGGSTGGGVDSWNARTGHVVPESGDYTTAQVTESGNLYFTTARVLATALTGYTAGSNTAILATDTILQAFGKTQGQLNARANSATTLEVVGTAGNIVVSGGAQSLAANRTWTVNLVAGIAAAGTYTKVTVDTYGRVTNGASLIAADIPALDASKITSGIFNVARLGSGTSGSGTYLQGNGQWTAFPAITSGTVTSVALSMPGIFNVSGSPVTSSGTLTAALATQNMNLVFAGPPSGSAAAPTFRALVAADIPNLDAAKITTGTIATARLGSGTANAGAYLAGDQTWKVMPTPATGTVTSVAVSSTDLSVSGSPITSAGTINLNIGTNAVTFSKFQQIPTQTLLGRYSAGTGNVQSITLGTNLTLNSSTGVLSAASSVYTAGGGIGLSANTFSVSAGTGLVQEANGLSFSVSWGDNRYYQTLYTSANPGQIGISGGNTALLNSLSYLQYQDFGATLPGGVYNIFNTTGSTGYPSTGGGGILRKYLFANDNGSTGSFALWKNGTDDQKLKINLGRTGTTWTGWQNIATEDWVSTQIPAAQTLSSNFYNISLSGGGGTVSVNSVIAPGKQVSTSIPYQTGLYPFSNTTGSTGYPAEFGGGIYFNRGGSGTQEGAFHIWKSGSSTPTLFYNVGTGVSTMSPYYAFASQEWVAANYAPITGGAYVLKAGDIMTGALSITTGGATSFLSGQDLRSGNVLYAAGSSTNTTYTGGGQLRIKASNNGPHITFHNDDGSRKALIGASTPSNNGLNYLSDGLNSAHTFYTNGNNRFQVLDGSIQVSGVNVVNNVTPTAGSHLTNKTYVDALAVSAVSFSSNIASATGTLTITRSTGNLTANLDGRYLRLSTGLEANATKTAWGVQGIQQYIASTGSAYPSVFGHAVEFTSGQGASASGYQRDFTLYKDATDFYLRGYNPSTGVSLGFNKIWHSGNFPYSPSSLTSGQILQYNGTNWVNAPLTITGFVPTTTNITINGVTQNLSTDRSWTIPALTSVSAGNGMSFTTITNTGTVTMGTPSSITLASTNSATSGTHTHAFAPGGTTGQYLRGDGSLATFPSIPTYTGSTSIVLSGTAFVRAALIGDVTSAQNSNTLVIANKAVSYAKMQDINPGTLIGRSGSFVNPWVTAGSWSYWNNSTTYSTGAQVATAGVGGLYRAISGNVGLDPISNPVYWQYLGPFSITYDSGTTYPTNQYVVVSGTLYRSTQVVLGVSPTATGPAGTVGAPMEITIGDGLSLSSDGVLRATVAAATGGGGGGGGGGATAITGLITQGTNITITGSGTVGSPYVINAAGGGGASYLYNLIDVTIAAPVSGQVLKWNGTAWVNAYESGSGYTLPIASAGTLGGIRVGSGLSIDGSGILSATGGGSGVDLRTAGDSGIGALRYAGTTRTAGQLYGGTTAPVSTTRLNYDGNLWVSELHATGDVVAFDTSDRRLKDNIFRIENPLDMLDKLGGYSYNWNKLQTTFKAGSKDYGVIAQEVEEVLPELVKTRDNGYKAVKYERLIAVLIEGVKELNEKVRRLEDGVSR